jgi:hypothetical protein
MFVLGNQTPQCGKYTDHVKASHCSLCKPGTYAKHAFPMIEDASGHLQCSGCEHCPTGRFSVAGSMWNDACTAPPTHAPSPSPKEAKHAPTKVCYFYGEWSTCDTSCGKGTKYRFKKSTPCPGVPPAPAPTGVQYEYKQRHSCHIRKCAAGEKPQKGSVEVQNVGQVLKNAAGR